jgi:hypothetical protein
MFSAVVSPTPPGHGPGSVSASIVANGETLPAVETCTIVVPVPLPFMSPLAGTVEATVLTVLRFARKGAELALEVVV